MPIIGTIGVGAAAAGAGAVAAKTGIFAAIKAFFVNNAATVAGLATTAALSLSGSSFKGKKHKVTFGPVSNVPFGNQKVAIPSVNYSRIDKSRKASYNSGRSASSRSKNASGVKYSRKHLK